MKPIISNPTMAAEQAYSVCLPLANMSKSQAKSPYQSNSDTSIRCSSFGSSVNCRSSSGSGGGFIGGFFGGLADGLAKDRIGKEAFNNVMDSCLARYGWRD